MQEYVFVLLIAVVLLALAWSWWAGRSDRDPNSSVDSFHRALSAMQPGDAPRGSSPQEQPATAPSDALPPGGDTSPEDGEQADLRA